MAARIGWEKSVTQAGTGVAVAVGRGVRVNVMVGVSVIVGVSVDGEVGVVVGVGVANRPENAGRLARCDQSTAPIAPQRMTSTSAPAIQRPAWLFFAGKGAGKGAGETSWTGSAGGGAAWTSSPNRVPQ